MLPDPLAQLDAFCAAHPLAPKVLLVPTVQAGDSLIAALAERGRTCIHLQVATPGGWAERWVGPPLRDAGWTRLAEGADRFVLHHVVGSVRAVADESVAAWLDQQTPHTLQSVVRELRTAGITASDVQSAPLASAKQHGLAALLDAYAERLAANQQYDRALLFQRGIETTGPSDVWFAVLDGTPISRLAGWFIRAVAGERLVRIQSATAPSGPKPPAESVAHRWDDVPRVNERGTVHPAASIWSTGLSSREREAVRLRLAPGGEAEVRGVLRNILARGIPFDQVEIAYTAADPYESQWHAAADRFDMPATFATGRLIQQTHTGHALQGFYDWLARGCNSEQLAMSLRACLYTFDRVLDDAPDASSVAAVLDRGGYGTGLHHHRALIDRLDAQYDADDPEHDRLRRVRHALDALTSLVPRDEPVTVDDMVTASIGVVTWFGLASIESASVTSIVERLREVAHAVGAITGTRSQLAGAMQRLVERHRVDASAARPGALHVAPLDRAGYTGRPHTYVVGLDASSVPGACAPDPALPDSDRAALDGLTPQAARAGEAEWHLYRLMAAVPETVTLSARTGDLASGAEGSPSAFFFRVADQLEYEDEAADVPVFPLVPGPSDLALDATEQLLARRAAARFEEIVHAQAPWLVAGLHAQSQRAEPTWTRFDGLTGRPAPQHALGTGAIATSPSRLETLVARPYRYFLKHVLEVEPRDVPDEDPTRWLDPLQFGALLHELYHDFMARVGGPVTDAEVQADALAALLDQKVEAYRDHIPVQHEAAFHADRTRLERAARIFLAAEAQHTGTVPVAFEVSFGQGHSGGLHRAQPVPVTLSDGVDLLLEGRIDRVDRLPNGNYAIWDYKTGSMYGYEADDLQDDGQRLQWALYAYAFDAMLEDGNTRGTVQQSGYFFANAWAYGQRLADAPPSRERLGAQLAPLLSLAEQGAFPHVQKRHGACRFCDYRRICADEATSVRDVRAMTPDASDDPVVDAIARWMSDG